MGCSASRTSQVVVPMPTKENVENPKTKEENVINARRKSSGNSTKRKVIQVKESDDSLQGSQTSLRSQSSKSNLDRESSAKSTRTADSGMGELEEEEFMITEDTKPDDFSEDRPPTPELSIDGQKIPRRKSPKEKRVSFSEKQDEVRSRINSLSPLGGVTERPQSRGGMAFDVMLCPETGNVKRRPAQLKKLEKRRRKQKRRTKEEIQEKLTRADERRKEHEQQLKEKAQAMIAKDKQYKNALDEFAMRQEGKEEQAA